MSKSIKRFVGMDAPKDSIDVATGEERGGEVRHYGAIGGDLAAVRRLARKLESTAHGPLVFVYEAGPCGFGIYRLLRARGHDCWVVSPGMTPRSNADRVKTDRRDCLKLAPLARAGELVPIHVPDQIDEAMRDLVRTREDAVVMQRQARQRLGALLLRNDIRYLGKTAWTPAHRRWIAVLKLPQPAQQLAFEEYVQAVEEAGQRILRLETAIRDELQHWRWRPVVAALQAFRGIQAIHAVRIVAELGDLTRFGSARQLMAYLGLVPSEHSSGQQRQQGSITKAGNSSARRALVEAAWAYRYGARVSPIIARCQSGLEKSVTELAWKAQQRLCARLRRLSARGLQRNKIVVAIARELSGFVWALGQKVKPC
jgi:transposase